MKKQDATKSMARTTEVLIHILLVLLISASVLGQDNTGLVFEDVFVASTPGDTAIRSMVGIDKNALVDFIRWELNIQKFNGEPQTFTANLHYGEAKPNSPGFISDGKRRTLQGNITISKVYVGNSELEMYVLKSSVTTAISLAKLNENLFHVISRDNKLMVGTGGWSYTLNRKEPVAPNTLPRLSGATIAYDTPDKVIFVGRTPCAYLAKEYNLRLGTDCNKIKWKLTLYFDQTTGMATTYSLERTGNRSSTIIGRWTILKGITSFPGATLYQLDPDKPGSSISFLTGDGDVLFFLDKTFHPLIGDGNFSYTLNRINN